MNCARCQATVSAEAFDVQRSSLRHVGVDETFGRLRCRRCGACVRASVGDGGWVHVDELLRDKKRPGGWQTVRDESDLLKLYVLSQVVHNEIEGAFDDSHVDFDFPDETDRVKILWKDGNAVGFYTLKLKGSLVFDTMESYEMTTLDTAYVRESCRRRGFGVSILEDVTRSFPDEDIGLSTPVSLSMYHVVAKFLRLRPSFRTRLWEVSGVGSEGNRRLVYFSLKKLFESSGN